MNLAAGRSARQLENIVMRLGCLMVSAALLVSLVIQPPKAKAFALTSGAIASLAGGFLNACGLAPVVAGMSNSGDVNEALARLIQDYLSAEVPGVKDAVSWIGDAALSLTGNGKIVIPKPVVNALANFAAWVASKYGTKPGMNQVFGGVTADYVTLADGSKFYLCAGSKGSGFANPGTPITQADFPIFFSTGYSMEIRYFNDPTPGDRICYLNPQGEVIHRHVTGFDDSSWWPMYIGIREGFLYFMHPSLSTGGVFSFFSLSTFDIGAVSFADESLAIDVADTITIPEDLTDDQSLALDVGAVAGLDIEGILQGILDAILAGDLAATAEIVATDEIPEEPNPDDIPYLPDGLDKLGAALTTRFPFSIPWDVYRGVKLLAAPAKAPYFEVDFMAPIAQRVGGWKGSTMIVMDFSEYEIIGQVCRWTSTIGFCLMLASGTKRLIWTA